MQLETNVIMGKTKKKERLKVSTAIIAVLMIGISVLIALFVCMPDLWQQFMMVKWEVFKGALIGIGILPVLLFVTIKGGKEWYKKWWVWASVVIVMGALVTIVILKGNNLVSTGGNMGMPPVNDPYSEMGGKKDMMLP